MEISGMRSVTMRIFEEVGRIKGLAPCTNTKTNIAPSAKAEANDTNANRCLKKISVLLRFTSLFACFRNKKSA
jgi:hypothetical protein